MYRKYAYEVVEIPPLIDWRKCATIATCLGFLATFWFSVAWLLHRYMT